MSSFSERIKELREYFGETQAEFGDKVKKSENTIWNWEAGKSTPHKNYMKVICERTGASFHWLSTGKGEMFDKLPNSKESLKIPIGGYSDSEIDNQKLFKVWGVTGAGHRFDYFMQENDPENLKPMELIRLDSLIDSNFLEGFKVSGDSMEPGITDGAYIGVDFENKHLMTGSIFVFNYPHEGLVVKKVQVKKDTVKIYSYNDRYDPEEYAHEELDEYVIVGRVMWIHNRL